MCEEAQLQARILELESRIAASNHPSPQSAHYSPRSYRRSPYYVPRGRGLGLRRGHGRGRSQYRGTLASDGRGLPNDHITDEQNHDPPGDGSWVMKNSGGSHQLISKSVYDRQASDLKMVTDENEKRHLERDARERTRLNSVFAIDSPEAQQVSSSSTCHDISINGVLFRVTNGGGKLVRIPDQGDEVQSIPKFTKIAGVTFRRSKTGNYFRSAVLKLQKYHQHGLGEEHLLISDRSREAGNKSKKLCAKFTATGSCTDGPRCRFTHDPDKVAICKEYLQKGFCPNGEHCDLSHELTAHRTPACLYFQRGNCTNNDCRYMHVKYKPAVLVCSSFAKTGYCERGADCQRRHVYECPEHANTGICHRKDCRLPHVDRAAQLRKISSVTTAKNLTDGDLPDLSSDYDSSELDGEDVDSDYVDEELLLPLGYDTDNEFEQQLDFVQL